MSDPLSKIPVKVVQTHINEDGEEEVVLYASRKKIYPRWVTGIFAKWRIFFVVLTQLIYYGLPWLPWNDRQGVLFDMVNRKFYIFGMVFLPQDFVYLSAILMISAFALFVFTAIAGRLWCGYACPQTVYTELFLWIEKWVEGDRPARMKLDGSPLSARKIRLKATKHALWIALALWTGITLVGYFTPIKTLLVALYQFETGPWETFWVFFYGFMTYFFAGWMREQVCKYMCPYARFQSAMFDSDTLIISYDTERGEPRGARRKGADPKAEGLGDCVNCGICVQVCPVGIDIRDGLQYECIGCAACIDGCDEVMDKLGYPRGLIRYTTENALKHQYVEQDIWKHLRRPRVILYGTVLLTVISITLVSLAIRVPLKVNINRDRAALSRETDDGRIENVFQLQIQNTSEMPHRYQITASGLPDLRLKLEGSDLTHEDKSDKGILVNAATEKTVSVQIQVNPDELEKGSHKFEFRIQSTDDPAIAKNETSTFVNR